MISVNGLNLAFGSREIFKNVSFRIGPRDRIGLVGSNGAGKSTLLKVLLGERGVDSGDVAKAKYVTVGYLPQDGLHAEGKNLLAEVESACESIVQVRDDLEQVRIRMAETDHASAEFTELLEIFGELQHKLENSDAFILRSKVEKILAGLGFVQSDFERMTEEFSGGWQMRIALAKLLLLQPSLLLLDEPTNHLDLESLQWLEEYLRTYDGALIIVSHDRRFLDLSVHRILEISLGALTEYHGNYSSYARERAERREQMRAAMQNQQQQIKHTEAFIERFRYKATKARQVQSRIKMLEKLEMIELEDEEDQIHFRFPPAPPSGRVVMELKGIRKSYGRVQVFDGIDWDIDRGDRIAFVGVNGAGKSTLSRIIAGVEYPDAGTRNPGHNVAIAYFAQDQADALDPSKEVLQTVDEIAAGDVRTRLRSILGAFLFRGDDVFKKVRVLSGGEKSRLALVKMLLQPSNLIVLDEPTNHLDMRSKGVLQEALQAYEGSFVIVSHDRDFLDPLVTKVVEFRKGGMKTHLGTISDYLDRKEREGEAGARGPVRGVSGGNREQSPRDRKRAEAELRQRKYRETRPLREAIARLEEDIERLERRKREIEAEMADPGFYTNGERVKSVDAEYRKIGKDIEAGYFRWNDLSRELERIEEDLRRAMETRTGE